MADTPTPSRQAIQRTTFSEQACRRFIYQLLTGRDGLNVKGRFSALHAAIAERDKAFHAKNPPKFNPPFDKMQTFQSDELRRVHQQAMIRLKEHPIRVQVAPPRDTQAQRDAAESLAVVFETGLEIAQEQAGVNLVGMLGDGAIRQAFGVLHWYKRKDVYPNYPDPDEVDVLPDDAAEAKRYRKTTARDRQRKRKPITKNYRETEASVKARDERARALAGFRWSFDVYRPDQVAFVADRGAKNHLGLFITMVSVGQLDYDEGLHSEGFQLSLNAKDPKIEIYEEQPRPERFEPSSDENAWGKMMRIARIWTRDECYELASYEQGEFSLLRSFPHDGRMVPFALVVATELNEPDPLYRYQPFLMGLYRTKPDYDYERSLGRALAEQTAVPRYWIELAPGEYWMDAHGNRVVLSEDAATAEALPAGAKLVKADLTVDPAFVEFLKMSGQDVERATPETGFADIGVDTAPHTLVMAQSQANAPIADLKKSIVGAFKIALRNIAEVESKSTDNLVVLAKVKHGSIQPGTMVSVDPKDIPGLDIDVSINPNSGAQEISIAELGRTWLHDDKAPFTAREWLQLRGVENPDGEIEKWLAEKAEFTMIGATLQRELVRRYGDTFVLGAGGTVVNAQGQAVDPMTVLATQGIHPELNPSPERPTPTPGFAPRNRPLPPAPPALQPMPGPEAPGPVMPS